MKHIVHIQNCIRGRSSMVMCAHEMNVTENRYGTNIDYCILFEKQYDIQAEILALKRRPTSPSPSFQCNLYFSGSAEYGRMVFKTKIYFIHKNVIISYSRLMDRMCHRKVQTHNHNYRKLANLLKYEFYLNDVRGKKIYAETRD